MTLINRLNPHDLRIVLVLQGGGALGAYQAGVYQALHEHHLIPDWIVGTSIGAINGAIIAGNDPTVRLHRLRAFWEQVAHPDLIDMDRVNDLQRQSAIWFNTVDTVFQGAPGFFSPRYFSGFALGWPVPPEQASFYDTSGLASTLHQLVDFDYLNAEGGMRLTVNAVNVRSGELAHFDSRTGKLDAEHVRASCSLPPGFPPVRIEDELYWDGGMYSNTPLESVLNELHAGDTLCFMVDLWSATGEDPTTLDEVRTRMKDVTYASRSQRHIDDYVTTHALQRKLRDLYARLPAESRTPEDDQELMALGCDSTMHIVRVPYTATDWHMASKDINFSRGSLEWRWDLGYKDAMRALRHAGWLRLVAEDTAVVVHDLPPKHERQVT